MRRPADASKAVYTCVLLGLVGIAAAAAIRYLDAPARASRASAQRATHVLVPPLARAALPASAPATLPVSLAGSTPPRLPLDARGHLLKARGVRDFFDYFSTAQNELSPSALDALVRAQIAAQWDGRPAQSEALDLWQRYRSYRQALVRLGALAAPVGSNDADSASGPQLDAMQFALDERASLASRMLGADWNEAFFGPDWRRGRTMIERLRIARDPTLTAEQKAARLQALEASMPAQERGANERGQHARATVDTIARLERQGMTDDELRAKATQALGAQAAERVVQMRRDEDAWRAQYADYAAQRAGIDAMGLAPGEREAQLARLRERMFATSAQRLRAASLDRADAH